MDDIYIILIKTIKVMNNSILSYSYASNEIKGYQTSEVAKNEKNDCFVRAVALLLVLITTQLIVMLKKSLGEKQVRVLN